MVPSFMIVDITKAHAMPLTVARNKAEEIALKIKAMKGLSGFQHAWDGDTIRFSIDSGAAKGVKGWLQVTQQAISVHIELNFAVAAAKAYITGEVERYLREAGVS